MRSRQSYVFVMAVAILLPAVGGCGATQRGTTPNSGRPANPVQLASAIDRSQAIIDGASRSGLQRAAIVQQLALRQLADHPSLRRSTVARLTSRARSAANAELRAAGALSKIVPAERGFPDWRIVAPPASTTLLSYYKAAAKAYHVPWQYLAAIELVETRMGRIRGLSPKGAQGPMQFMRPTWSEYGRGSINDQRDSIMAAARFLNANGAKSNIGRALLHYNPSQSYVDAVESYAREMGRDRHAYFGYYYWQVLYQTTKGTFLLPLGYPRVRPKRLPS